MQAIQKVLTGSVFNQPPRLTLHTGWHHQQRKGTYERGRGRDDGPSDDVLAKVECLVERGRPGVWPRAVVERVGGIGHPYGGR